MKNTNQKLESRSFFGGTLIQSFNNKNHLENHFENKQNSKPKVDINQLLNRVRDEKKKERKENLLLLSLVGSVIVITGIIASL